MHKVYALYKVNMNRLTALASLYNGVGEDDDDDDEEEEEEERKKERPSNRHEKKTEEKKSKSQTKAPQAQRQHVRTEERMGHYQQQRGGNKIVFNVALRPQRPYGLLVFLV